MTDLLTQLALTSQETLEETIDCLSTHISLDTINQMSNQIIKIFLASSKELKEDREQFEIFINRKNKEYIKQGIFLELVIWEDFLDAMSAICLQDEYNKAIKECDVVISLFKTKVGQYTEEEVMTAWKTFKQKGKPLIYTYFKEFTISSNEINLEHFKSLNNFKNKLGELGHFYTIYKNIEELKYKFSEQLSQIVPTLQNSQSNEQNIELKSKEHTVPKKKKTFRRQLLETEKNN